MISKHPIIALTPGDPGGIGPEITWKAISSRSLTPNTPPILCIGAREPFEKLRVPIVECDLNQSSLIPPKRKRPFIWLLAAPDKAPQKAFLPGFQAGWSIEKATQLVINGTASSLVTGPISKERLQKGGYIYPGHTEFLAHLCKTREVTMMLANSLLRVSLVTTHISLKDVSGHLTGDRILRAITQTSQGLRTLWGIAKPRIAVAALNPHAGESGLFGREEIELITPTLNNAQKELSHECEISGPFPADTLFAKHILSQKKSSKNDSPNHYFDAIVCMYHDQGLIPVKLLDFHHTVNITLGLPMIRTSVDHGVGFDIVGKGTANPSSLEAALKLATQFIEKRQKI